ncbi:hypothetical protein [Cognatishimia sp. F0-27]|uniref:hypothetical protein n=1 Tax=Cognatishimia sp. F0-27 TaxID=2816855 RepID=UPI001D0C7713|nr:hypothetical protein [Cognatishimia sp. F0-27]MCC1491536.1 hypothetical protein [Cognatishimia sp. F0-27]
MSTRTPLLLWLIVLYATLNGLWQAFAASGIWLLDPAATMGDIRPVRSTLVTVHSAISALLFLALAWLAYKRRGAALWIALLLVPVKLIGWSQAVVAAPTLPDLPGAMIVIFITYRVASVIMLLVIAAYLWRLRRKNRVG